VSDDAKPFAARMAGSTREADLVSNRLSELYENPVKGKFDIEHLKRVHAYIFQDLPEHKPGVIRERTEDAWIKHRVLEGERVGYMIFYAHEGIPAKIVKALTEFGGPSVIRAEAPDAVATRITQLYSDLDYAHGFYEGNSRTLREFTRTLAGAAGYHLDWVKAGVGTKERNQLYRARDLAVLQRAFPGLNEHRAMTTNDRAEYEAWYGIDRLRREVGDMTLAAIIRDRLSREFGPEPTWDTGRGKCPER
jgi:cell filamentation protein